MTTNPNLPAFPVNDNHGIHVGLSIRAEFAKCFAAAIVHQYGFSESECRIVAKSACLLTDALIAELNKEPNGQP